MTTGCLARYFLALSFSALLVAAAAPDFKAYRERPTVPVKEQILSFAKQHAKDQAGAIAYFALGEVAFEQKSFAEAEANLKAAQPHLPRIADYIAFYIASSAVALNDDPRAIAELRSVSAIKGPLRSQAAILEARALIRTKAYAEAVKLLRERIESLPQPDANVLLAQAYEAQGELARAAAVYQSIYYTQAATAQAADAGAALERLKKAMGADYPPAMPQQMLARGSLWLAKKQYARAKTEFHDMLPLLGGLERDQAAVRSGAADLLGANPVIGAKYLKTLQLAHSEADAERDYYLGEAGLPDLDKNYPASPWRLKTLVSTGDSLMAKHETEHALSLFRVAAAQFPADSVTAVCHWRVAWQAYLDRAPDALSLMKEQVAKYPDDQRAASALYFLGRLAEESADLAAAHAWYIRLKSLFPHYYYGALGTGRLADPAIEKAVPNPEILRFIDQVKFPERRGIPGEPPTPATIAHIERSRLLASAGFPDWAESELRYGAGVDGQRHLLALELAKSAPTLAAGLRHMKVLTPEYLTLDYDRAPKEVWGYLFPLPLQGDLVKTAQETNLDPYLVAGLIRQESEFNPVVVSRAHAVGLMQLEPATGRMMARKAGVAPFDLRMLLDPAVSLKLGTSYLREQLDRWSGNLEQTLAAYNAGPGRVQRWVAGVHFREPAEFVESIPITETREYVQSVIRNATVYRQLYSTGTPPPQPKNALTSSHVSAPNPKPPVARKRPG
jgi:soluble lytic murein transglycosylase